jgi:hypothetical protein
MSSANPVARRATMIPVPCAPRSLNFARKTTISPPQAITNIPKAAGTSANARGSQHSLPGSRHHPYPPCGGGLKDRAGRLEQSATVCVALRQGRERPLEGTWQLSRAGTQAQP